MATLLNCAGTGYIPVVPARSGININVTPSTLLFAIAVSALVLVGCGSSDSKAGTGSDGGPGSSGQGCQPPVLDGTPFGANGTATLTGAGTLPDGIPDGLELQLLVKQGIGSIGVLPDDLFNANDRICGKSFHYTVKKLTAGTYTLTFEASDTSSASLMPEFKGTAPSDFTVVDGQTVAQDTVFLLSSM